MDPVAGYSGRMISTARIDVFSGQHLLPYLEAVAQLRLRVFRDWPYLYDGALADELGYLATYATSADSVFVLARDADDIVGASTGLPLLDDGPALRKPFVEAGQDPAQVFYLGESVLLPDYRGQGIGHAFFDARHAHARQLGRFSLTAFCSVDRGHDDPRRPPGYRANDVFWHKRGYVRQPGMTIHLDWHETGRGAITHPLTFWTRPLENVA